MIDVDVMQGYIRDANPIPTLDDLDPDELTAFVTAARSRRAELMQASTQHPTTPTTSVTPPPRQRKVWAFAAAFILVVASIGIAVFLVRGGDEVPVADEPMAPVTVSSPPPTTSAPDPFDVQSLTWSRVPHDDAVFNPTVGEDDMKSVTAGGPGFVAVGSIITTTDPDADGADAGVWVSEDGITWSLVTSVEPTTPGPKPTEVDPLRTGLELQWMESVTVGGPGLVAVGTDWNAPGVLSVATVWTSEDAISWSKVTVESEFSWMYDVTAGGPGLVAVGSVYGASRCDGAAWTSVDGLTWNRVPDHPDIFCGEINGVTVGGPGLVAVGVNDDGAAVWTSPDGLTWTPVPHDEAVFGGGTMLDVTAGGPGLVAVGSMYEADVDSWGGAVWTSVDGLTWTLVPPTELPHGDVVLRSVVSVGSQLVAVEGMWSSDDVAVVWTSDNGVAWTQTEVPEEGTMNSVVATENGLIAVGGVRDGAAAVWIATEG